MARDPIVNPKSNASASVKNASKGRVFSINGGGANYSGSNATTKAAPAPNNPYTKGR